MTIPFEHQLESAGIFSITCRLDRPDDLPEDNSDSLIVEAVEQVPLLILSPDDEASGGRSETSYLLAALGHRAIGDEDADWESVFRPTVASIRDLETLSLAGYYAVVLVDVPELSPAAVESLTEYVRAGGGLWIALGEHADSGDLQQFIVR